MRLGCTKDVQGGSLSVPRALVLRWYAHGAAGAHHSTHGTICTVILLFHWFEFKKLVSVEEAPSYAYGFRFDGK